MQAKHNRFLITAGVASLAVGQAHAQDTAAPDAPVIATDDIVVTARKREERLRDVPISLELVSSETLQNANITQTRDLVARVPSLSLSYGANSPYAQIRGLGTGNNPSFDQAVGKFVDNVSYGRDQDLRLPLFDVERVEVLKGPQVLLYGNSTTAGALNITTRKPGDEMALDASIGYEFNAQELVAQGGMTLPLASALSLRVSGIYQLLQKGHVFNTLTDEFEPKMRNYAGRAILRLDATPDLRFLAKVELDRLRTDGSPAELYVPAGFGPSPFTETDLDGVTATNNNVAPFFQPAFNQLHNDTYQLDTTLNALGGTITSTTAYRRSTYAGSLPAYHPIPIANATITNGYRQFSQELRYSGSIGAIDVTIGGFYQHETTAALQAIDFNLGPLGFPLPPFAANFVLDQKTNSYSAFADATFHASERLSIELGARLLRVERDASQSAASGNVVPNKRIGMGAGAADPNPMLGFTFGILFGSTPHSFTSLQFRDTRFQPQAVVQYKLDDFSQVYGKFVKGDKAGGFDSNYPGTPAGNLPADTRFETESATAFEIGLKGVSADDRFSYALAAFHTTIDDLQANAFVAAATVSLVTNVGKARTQGVEVEFGYRPVPGLSFNATGTYADAQYLQYPGAACTIAQAAVGGPACLQDLSRTPTPMSSRWVGTLGVEFERPIGDVAIKGGMTIIARSSYNPSSTNDPYLEQKGYAQLDGHIGLSPAGSAFAVSLFGRNLTDVRYFEYGEATPVTPGTVAIFRARGRQVGLRAELKF